MKIGSQCGHVTVKELVIVHFGFHLFLRRRRQSLYRSIVPNKSYFWYSTKHFCLLPAYKDTQVLNTFLFVELCIIYLREFHVAHIHNSKVSFCPRNLNIPMAIVAKQWGTRILRWMTLKSFNMLFTALLHQTNHPFLWATINSPFLWPIIWNLDINTAIISATL